MFKRILVYVTAVIVIEALIYYGIHNIISTNESMRVDDNSTIALDAEDAENNPQGIKRLIGLMSGIVTDKDNARNELKRLLSEYKVVKKEKAAKAVRFGTVKITRMEKQPQLVTVPLWVNENEYCRLTQDPIFVRVNEIN